MLEVSVTVNTNRGSPGSRPDDLSVGDPAIEHTLGDRHEPGSILFSNVISTSRYDPWSARPELGELDAGDGRAGR
jgi:hypothetical protein